MSLNNITLNLSDCITSVAKAELSKSEHQCKFNECRRKPEYTIETQVHTFAILHANVNF